MPQSEMLQTQECLRLFSTHTHIFKSKVRILELSYLIIIDGKTNISVNCHTFHECTHKCAGVFEATATELPVVLCSAGFSRAGKGSFAQPANMAAVMGVTSEQQRMITILWPLLISS